MVSDSMKAVQQQIDKMKFDMSDTWAAGVDLQGVERELWSNLIDAFIKVRNYEGEG